MCIFIYKIFNRLWYLEGAQTLTEFLRAQKVSIMPLYPTLSGILFSV